MTKRVAKVHLDTTSADATDGTRSLLCGRVASVTAVTTADRDAVTCAECRKRLALLDASAERDTAQPAGLGPELPYQGRGAHMLEQRDLDLVARLEAIDAGKDVPPEPRWRSIDRAAEQWARVVDDGTPIRSSFRSEAPVQSSYLPSSGGGREDVLSFSIAIDGAYRASRSFGETLLSVEMQRRILEWRMCGRPVEDAIAPGRKGRVVRRVACSVEQLARTLTRELGTQVTERQVSLVEMHGRERVYEALVAAGEVVPGGRDRIPFDALVGLGAIAAILGVTPATAARYVDDANTPIRQSRRGTRVVHWTLDHELRAWMERTRGPWTWDLLGAS